MVSAYPLDAERRAAFTQALSQLADRELVPEFAEDACSRRAYASWPGSWVLMANLRDELGFFAKVSIMAVEGGLLERLSRRVDDYRLTLRLGEKGRVASVGDGIAWVYGLPSAAVDEISAFRGRQPGLGVRTAEGAARGHSARSGGEHLSGSLVSHTASAWRSERGTR